MKRIGFDPGRQHVVDGRDRNQLWEMGMATVSIIKNILTDGSETFDLLIQHGGGSITIETICDNERKASIVTSRIIDAMESAMGAHVEWADMLINKG